jgi:peptide/nickel transport system substrate-binding protein
LLQNTKYIKDIDFINDLDASFKDEVLSKTGMLKEKWKNQIILEKQPFLNVEYLGVLLKPESKNGSSQLQEIKIRKALSYAIDRNKMLLYLRNSVGTPAVSGFCPKGLPSYNANEVKGLMYDTAAARRLIREAGYDQQHPLPQLTLVTVPSYAVLGSFLVNELNKLGFNIHLEVMQKGLLLQKMSSNEVSFFRGSWIADFPDAINFFSVFLSSNPSPPNYTRYQNPVFDSLYAMAVKESNAEKRYSLYWQMDKILMADMPVIPLWYDCVLQLRQPELAGFHPNALNHMELKRVRKIKATKWPL